MRTPNPLKRFATLDCVFDLLVISAWYQGVRMDGSYGMVVHHGWHHEAQDGVNPIHNARLESLYALTYSSIAVSWVCIAYRRLHRFRFLGRRLRRILRSLSPSMSLLHSDYVPARTRVAHRGVEGLSGGRHHTVVWSTFDFCTVPVHDGNDLFLISRMAGSEIGCSSVAVEMGIHRWDRAHFHSCEEFTAC